MVEVVVFRTKSLKGKRNFTRQALQWLGAGAGGARQKLSGLPGKIAHNSTKNCRGTGDSLDFSVCLKRYLTVVTQVVMTLF